jgi:hypothetical protein
MKRALTSSVRDALDDIILGRTVKRARHDLMHDGTDLTDHFLELLTKHGFVPSTVGATHIQPGERVPAFYLEGSTAYFGWVFWEKFSQLRLRKLFGTVVRNTKGDWFIQLPSNSPAIIYINTSTIFEMDIDRPFEL